MGIIVFILIILFVTEWLGPVILLSIPAYWIFRALSGDTDAMVGLAILAITFVPFVKFVREYLDRKNEPANRS